MTPNDEVVQFWNDIQPNKNNFIRPLLHVWLSVNKTLRLYWVTIVKRDASNFYSNDDFTVSQLLGMVLSFCATIINIFFYYCRWEIILLAKTLNNFILQRLARMLWENLFRIFRILSSVLFSFIFREIFQYSYGEI